MGYSAGRFFRDLNRVAKQAESASRRRHRNQERINRQNQRAYEQEIRQQERDIIADERENRRLYVESRVEEANELNIDQSEKIEELNNLLPICLGQNITLHFKGFLIAPKQTIEDYGDLIITTQAPSARKSILLFLLKMLSWIHSFKEKYLKLENELEAKHKEKLAEWQSNEKERINRLDKKRTFFKEAKEKEQLRVDEYNNNIYEWEKSCESGESLALSDYYEQLLPLDDFPEGFPNDAKAVYISESKMLAIQYNLPTMEKIIPLEKSFKYVKASDAITSTTLSEKYRKELYSKVVASTALRVIHTVFQDKFSFHVETITLNCHVKTIDLATGKKINPCLLSVRVGQEVFNELDLEHVNPIICLKELRASISASPSELLPVKPIIEFNMNDPRFVSGSDILSELDNRPNLMDLNPSEFEGLITNLFQKMGLETKLTRASRDGGIDCVAYDPRPVLGGKVVVQAKRYKNTVGVSAVRDLFGAMDHERASKGILVTTSGYGKASFEFANGKPIELLDGANLLYLLKEHAGIDAKIIMPTEEI